MNTSSFFSTFDRVIVLFLNTLSTFDLIVVGFIIITIVVIIGFAMCWYQNSQETVDILREIRDILKSK